jgi:lipid-binding SYLF domain-containing protein
MRTIQVWRSKLNRIAVAFAAAVLCLALPGWAATKEERQAEVRKTAEQTLERLYRLQPRAKEAIEKAAGYAVFSNFGMKLLAAGGGTGSGVAVERTSKREVFMKMVEVQAGLGFGVKKFQLVWIFETQKAFDDFVRSGWEIGAQTTATAKLGNQGAWAAGALSVSPGVWLYQLAGDGLAVELTAKGTKYYRDDTLN